MREKRIFTAHPHIIYDLIKSQAGSLGKAIVECVMNSVDANATKVIVTLSQTGLEITDNGKGFTSKQEIQDWFEVFGFPHEEDSRVYGKFGIGRAQMWVFAATQWRTGEFLMDVDVKHKGLDYDLEGALPIVAGVSISGKFYETLSMSDLLACEKEVAELAKYAPIPVILNNRQISVDPSTEKWDYDTPEAWIKLKDSGDLAVYNLGVLVRKYPGYLVGAGGVVVTKPTFKLKLNMARNDILASQCDVWKKIKPFLEHKSQVKATKKASMTESERDNLANRIKAESIEFKDIVGLKLFTDTRNKNCNISQLAALRIPLTVEPDRGSTLAEHVHRSGLAYVLSQKTLDRFGVDTVSELVQLLLGFTEKPTNQPASHWVTISVGQGLHRLNVIDQFSEAAKGLSDVCTIVPHKDLDLEEKLVCNVINQVNATVVRGMQNAGILLENANPRKVYIGISDSADAWTDGTSYIAINRSIVKKTRQGLKGFLALSHLLVHEYMHDCETAGSHLHDLDFYEIFHNYVIDASADAPIDIASTMLSKYATAMRTSKLKTVKAVISDIDRSQLVFEPTAA